MNPLHLETALRASGLSFRCINVEGSTGFLVDEFPDTVKVLGSMRTTGLFLITQDDVTPLLSTACPGAKIVETATLRVVDSEVPIYRYTKPGEPSKNLSRRENWFQKR